MLPTHVIKLPDGTEVGDYIVLDFGGKFFRERMTMDSGWHQDALDHYVHGPGKPNRSIPCSERLMWILRKQNVFQQRSVQILSKAGIDGPNSRTSVPSLRQVVRRSRIEGAREIPRRQRRQTLRPSESNSLSSSLKLVDMVAQVGEHEDEIGERVFMESAVYPMSKKILDSPAEKLFGHISKVIGSASTTTGHSIIL